MKKLPFILIFISTFAFGQVNLVPNPGFELYTVCPGIITDLLNWQIYGGSPDVYNTCSTYTTNSVPANWYGYQTPLDGNGYTSVITYCNPCAPTREYIGTQLTQTLNIGTKYFASVYISKTDSADPGWVNCPTNRFGFRFSTVAFSDTSTSFALPDNYSQINSTVTITNSTGWTKISGSFIADSNYTHVALGNFFDNLNMDTTSCNYPEAFGFYYVDRVCVSTDSMLCNDITNINQFTSKYPELIYPNPSTGLVTINLSTNGTVIVLNKVGEVILTKQDFLKGDVDLSNYIDGIYFIKIMHDNRTTFNKVIITH